MRTILFLGVLIVAGCAASGDRPLQLVSGAGAPYPATARERGIEGFVMVRYDVDESGRVVNAAVVSAQPTGVFEEAALAAVSAWEYSPRMVDGKAVAVRGLTSRVSFKLDSGDSYEDY
jgi:protein TonB